MTDDRRRSRWIEVRTTADECALADRVTFVLTAAQADAWDAFNAQPARELAGVRALSDRPSAFQE